MKPLDWPRWGTVEGLWRRLAHVSITSGRCGPWVLWWLRTWKICLGNCWEQEHLQGQQGK